jgi:hypothetical protein
VTQSSAKAKSKGLSRTVIIAIAAGAGVLLIIIIIVIALVARKKRERKEDVARELVEETPTVGNDEMANAFGLPDFGAAFGNEIEANAFEEGFVETNAYDQGFVYDS